MRHPLRAIVRLASFRGSPAVPLLPLAQHCCRPGSHPLLAADGGGVSEE